LPELFFWELQKLGRRREFDRLDVVDEGGAVKGGAEEIVLGLGRDERPAVRREAAATVVSGTTVRACPGGGGAAVAGDDEAAALVAVAAAIVVVVVVGVVVVDGVDVGVAAAAAAIVVIVDVDVVRESLGTAVPGRDEEGRGCVR
jgi:hypothetical protein